MAFAMPLTLIHALLDERHERSVEPRHEDGRESHETCVDPERGGRKQPCGDDGHGDTARVDSPNINFALV